ncbi:VENN motif pre-toxin domain-containing protein [Pseudomonas poae]|uniref:VENN motif pre-toxin domain-containing protein n=1 Tax=Pseudomonas poae TaxID=200451 RepID=UPI0030E475B8
MGGAVTGAQAGTNAVQNNYLSEGQKAQRDAEMAACPGAGCRTGTATKWLAIDISQDAVFTAGALSGAAIGLNESIDSIVHTAGNFTETITALKSVVESGGVWDSVKQSYIDRLDKLQMHYEEAGASGSYLAGVETGKLLIDMASVLADGAGLVKGVPCWRRRLRPRLPRRSWRWRRRARRVRLHGLALRGSLAEGFLMVIRRERLRLRLMRLL